jgi:hypothetical protein
MNRSLGHIQRVTRPGLIAHIESLESQLTRLKADNEMLLWNLAGCSTFALGYGLNEPFAEEKARPAMFDVLKLAKREARMREALELLYLETADYIKINNLGDVHHNRSMQLAKSALAQGDGGGK